MRNCTRRLEWDAAHRVMEHESKCKNLHGHRYTAEVTCESADLDPLGRVVDFSIVKSVVGRFIDEAWDHGTIANGDDERLLALCRESGWKHYSLPSGVNPTAENLAQHLFSIASRLLNGTLVRVVHVRIYETPNCWADYGVTS